MHKRIGKQGSSVWIHLANGDQMMEKSAWSWTSNALQPLPMDGFLIYRILFAKGTHEIIIKTRFTGRCGIKFNTSKGSIAINLPGYRWTFRPARKVFKWWKFSFNLRQTFTHSTSSSSSTSKTNKQKRFLPSLITSNLILFHLAPLEGCKWWWIFSP